MNFLIPDQITDNEIIKALEQISKGESRGLNIFTYGDIPLQSLLGYALDFINRQKAEKAALIEHLKKARKQIKFANAEVERYRAAVPYLEQKDDDFCSVVCRFAEGLIEKAKAEAIKDFVERLHGKARASMVGNVYVYGISLDNINEVKKEMVGDG